MATYVFLVPPPTFVSFAFLSTVVLVKLHDRYKEGGRALEKLIETYAFAAPLFWVLRRTSSVFLTFSFVVHAILREFLEAITHECVDTYKQIKIGCQMQAFN